MTHINSPPFIVMGLSRRPLHAAQTSTVASSLACHFAVALFLRLAFTLYGVYHDQKSDELAASGDRVLPKYTDIDYSVFTDAATYMYAEGRSPYERATYRYTPLLAWLMQPNVFLAHSFGKCLFVACDMLCGWLILKIVNGHNASSSKANAARAVLLVLQPAHHSHLESRQCRECDGCARSLPSFTRSSRSSTCSLALFTHWPFTSRSIQSRTRSPCFSTLRDTTHGSRSFVIGVCTHLAWASWPCWRLSRHSSITCTATRFCTRHTCIT